MSIRGHVMDLVAMVERGQFLGAIETFYAEQAITQEPGQPPTTGKPALLAKERAFLASVQEWHAQRAIHVLVDGSHAAIHWRMELTRSGGQRIVLEEIALQEWSGTGTAARVVHEQYFPFRG